MYVTRKGARLSFNLILNLREKGVGRKLILLGKYIHLPCNKVVSVQGT